MKKYQIIKCRLTVNKRRTIAAKISESNSIAYTDFVVTVLWLERFVFKVIKDTAALV